MADAAPACPDVETEKPHKGDTTNLPSKALHNSDCNHDMETETSMTEKSKTDEPEIVILESSNVSSLGQLCFYESDSDDSVLEIPQANDVTEIKNNYNYRISQQVVVSDSEEDSEEDSDSEGYTDDSSSTTSSSSSSTAVASSDDSDSDSEIVVPRVSKRGGVRNEEPKTEGELSLSDLPPIEDLHITVPKQECMELGQIESVVDTLVVVQAKKNSPALDLDSILFLDHGDRPLGKVFDVFGPVTEPCYCVRFNSLDHIQEKGIEKGMTVYCAPRTPYSSYVFLPDLLRMKGSDASWEANNEPPPKHLDYSDDEEERLARRASRSYKKEGVDVDPDQPSCKKRSNYEQFMNSRNLRMSAASVATSRGHQGPFGGTAPSNTTSSSSTMLIRPPSFGVPPPRCGTVAMPPPPTFSSPPPFARVSVPRFDPRTPPPQSPVPFNIQPFSPENLLPGTPPPQSPISFNIPRFSPVMMENVVSGTPPPQSPVSFNSPRFSPFSSQNQLSGTPPPQSPVSFSIPRFSPNLAGMSTLPPPVYNVPPPALPPPSLPPLPPPGFLSLPPPCTPPPPPAHW